MVRQELRLGKGWVEENLLFDENVVVGYVLLRYDDDLVDITRLGVHPEMQGKGLGGRLLRKALEEKATIILTVRKNNLAAMKLYFKHGFEIVAHLHAAGAWVMRRAIREEVGG
jgi:ribosomal protein S18 acetylase RimI-like enzyme